jgi:cell division protein FtsL
MASWGEAAPADAPVLAPPRRKPRAIPSVRPVNPLRSGVTWIVVVGALLAGLVALNVAVLQLNVRLDKLNRERADLVNENAALSSQLSSASASPRIESLARRRLGLVYAPTDATTYVELGGK